MNHINEAAGAYLKSATTERKPGRRRKAKGGKDIASSVPLTPLASTEETNRNESDETTQPAATGVRTMNTHAIASDVLNAATSAKFVLFGIARADQVDKGPVMRGFIEVKGEDNGPAVKVNVAAWRKIGRTSGTEYLSLKVGNNSQEDPEDYTVGPFYGRLFRQVEGNRTRYFGFIEDSEKTGEDENGQGTYETHWQLRVSAKPAVSNDGKTRYINGGVVPSQQHEDNVEDNNLPF